MRVALRQLAEGVPELAESEEIAEGRRVDGRRRRGEERREDRSDPAEAPYELRVARGVLLGEARELRGGLLRIGVERRRPPVG